MCALLLNSCTSLTPDISLRPGDNYQQALSQLDTWSLRGRLNIRSEDSSPTININWQQAEDEFEIDLSGTLGMGAVKISGNPRGVLIDNGSEDAIIASSLEAISNDILGYVFPANSLLYWIKGLPAPGSNAEITRTQEGLIDTLSQIDQRGNRWALQYDRYQNSTGIILPGRIRMEQAPYRLTFLINDWEITGGSD